jgi:hypothetical protein
LCIRWYCKQIIPRVEKCKVNESNSKIPNLHRNQIDHHRDFVAARCMTVLETWPTTWRYNHLASDYENLPMVTCLILSAIFSLIILIFRKYRTRGDEAISSNRQSWLIIFL